jgi:carbamoyl-phosphate synthase large subunit
MQNTLVLSAGRRVELIRSFKEQRDAMGLNSRILSADINPQLAPACHVADDAFQCPRATEAHYIDSLLALCKQQGVGLVIPTIDTELLPLARNRALFSDNNIHVSVADLEVVEKCRDKRQSGELFAEMGLSYPEIYKSHTVRFPAFAKPVSGSSSKGVMILHTASDAKSAVFTSSQTMICEYIGPPFVEYTVDAYFDFGGVLKCLVPRLRIETRAGEVSKGVTRKNPVYTQLVVAASKLKGCRGCITIQVFYNPETEKIIGLEINPRFGGGYPLSYAAGAPFPGWLMGEAFLQQQIPLYDEWTADLLMLRYDAAIWVENAK